MAVCKLGKNGSKYLKSSATLQVNMDSQQLSVTINCLLSSSKIIRHTIYIPVKSKALVFFWKPQSLNSCQLFCGALLSLVRTRIYFTAIDWQSFWVHQGALRPAEITTNSIPVWNILSRWLDQIQVVCCINSNITCTEEAFLNTSPRENSRPDWYSIGRWSLQKGPKRREAVTLWNQKRNINEEQMAFVLH